jgi:Fe-S-cluster containining protein
MQNDECRMQNEELSLAVGVAIENPMACDAVREVYERLHVEIDCRRPVCVASGRCCHFESYGHRLYVTTLELAVFRRDLRDVRPDLNAKRLPIVTDGCPLQSGRLCGVHAIRPFGCRIFFCDPTAADWQQEQYERFHAELKRLHQKFAIPYFYVEWRQALAALGVCD